MLFSRYISTNQKSSWQESTTWQRDESVKIKYIYIEAVAKLLRLLTIISTQFRMGLLPDSKQPWDCFCESKRTVLYIFFFIGTSFRGCMHKTSAIGLTFLVNSLFIIYMSPEGLFWVPFKLPTWLGLKAIGSTSSGTSSISCHSTWLLQRER